MSRALASTIDIAPTILARSGIAPYHGMQGRSLLPCLDGQVSVQDGLLIEYQGNRARQGFARPASVRTLPTQRHRLSIYKDESWGPTTCGVRRTIKRFLLAFAQEWPDRAIRVIVPGGPGSPADVAIRAMQDVLTKHLGQGIIGVDAVAPALRAKTPFDLQRDLVPVVQLTSESPVLLVREGLGTRTLADLVALAKKQPGQLTFGSAGAGTPSHLGMALLQRAAGIELRYVPYRTVASAVTDLAGGTVDVVLAGSAAAQQDLNGGRMVPLAISAPQRKSGFPRVPTLAQAGYPGIDLRGWTGIVVPTGLPAPVSAKLAKAFAAVLAQPAVIARIEAPGAQVSGMAGAAFEVFVQSEAQRWRKVVVDARITADRAAAVWLYPWPDDIRHPRTHSRSPHLDRRTLDRPRHQERRR